MTAADVHARHTALARDREQAVWADNTPVSALVLRHMRADDDARDYAAWAQGDDWAERNQTTDDERHGA
jgi:hypothetical protein